MQIKTLTFAILASAVFAAPYPNEASIESIESTEQLPKGGLGKGKSSGSSGFGKGKSSGGSSSDLSGLLGKLGKGSSGGSGSSDLSGLLGKLGKGSSGGSSSPDLSGLLGKLGGGSSGGSPQVSSRLAMLQTPQY